LLAANSSGERRCRLSRGPRRSLADLTRISPRANPFVMNGLAGSSSTIAGRREAPERCKSRAIATCSAVTVSVFPRLDNHCIVFAGQWTAGFAIGAVKPGKDKVYLDRHAKIDVVVPASATSSSNAIACGSVLLLRKPIEKSGYDWKKDGPNHPEAMMAILQRTGQPVKDPATKLTFRRLDLKAALDDVFQRAKR
jgi:hypothetical protein